MYIIIKQVNKTSANQDIIIISILDIALIKDKLEEAEVKDMVIIFLYAYCVYQAFGLQGGQAGYEQGASNEQTISSVPTVTSVGFTDGADNGTL
ncbi:MAG: hypothetical protein EZS28_055364, partial [Streblomastix strix]